MELTIKRYSRKMTYENAATLDEFWELVKRTERSLEREQRRHWDVRECDEYLHPERVETDSGSVQGIFRSGVL